MKEEIERPECQRREGRRSVRFAFGRRSSLFCVPVLFLYPCLLWVYVFYGFYVGPAKLQRGATPPSVMVLFSFSSPFFQIGCTFFWIDWMYWISLDWSWPDIWFIANISYFYSFSSVLSSIRCRLFKVLVEAAISITPRSGPFKTHCTFKENISSVGVLRRQCFTEQS